MADEKTKNLKLPLPHADNTLDQDLPRLRESFGILDEEIGGIKTRAENLAAGTYGKDDVERLIREGQLQGPPGPPGPPGAPGAAGLPGPKGDPGDPLQLSDAVNSGDSRKAASSKAVKTAYDKALEAAAAGGEVLSLQTQGYIPYGHMFPFDRGDFYGARFLPYLIKPSTGTSLQLSMDGGISSISKGGLTANASPCAFMGANSYILRLNSGNTHYYGQYAKGNHVAVTFPVFPSRMASSNQAGNDFTIFCNGLSFYRLDGSSAITQIPAPPAGSSCESMIVTEDGVVYAVMCVIVSGNRTYNVYKSADKGASWQLVAQGVPGIESQAGSPTIFADAAGHLGIVSATISALNITCSVDGGAAWNVSSIPTILWGAGSGDANSHLTWSPAFGAFLAITSQGVFKSEIGRKWTLCILGILNAIKDTFYPTVPYKFVNTKLAAYSRASDSSNSAAGGGIIIF